MVTLLFLCAKTAWCLFAGNTAKKANHSIPIVTSNWNFSEANVSTVTLVLTASGFMAFSRIICKKKPHSGCFPLYILYSFIKKRKHGLLRNRGKKRSGKASPSLLLIYQTKSPGSLCAINLTRQKVWQLGALATHLRLLTLPRIKCSQEAPRNTGFSD